MSSIQRIWCYVVPSVGKLVRVTTIVVGSGVIRESVTITLNVVARVLRVQCSEHGIKMVSVPWADARVQFTTGFEARVIDWSEDAGSLSTVATRLKVSWRMISNIMERAVKRGLARRMVVLRRTRFCFNLFQCNPKFIIQRRKHWRINENTVTFHFLAQILVKPMQVKIRKTVRIYCLHMMILIWTLLSYTLDS